MPKKRHTNQYTKPPSTSHASLSISGGGTSKPRNEAPSSVNDLLAGLRRAQISSEPRDVATTNAAPTLPPTIRNFLNIPDTPAPQPRRRQRVDATGRRLPAGPAPPRSWLEESIYAPQVGKSQDGSERGGRNERLFPESVDHLPGIMNVPKLVEVCLRQLATNWKFHKVYDQYYLSSLPTPLRSALLSYLAVYGPEEGIGNEGMKILLGPSEEQETGSEWIGNDDFYRLDLSGSIGRSITFKQLQNMLTASAGSEEARVEDSWEEAVPSIRSSPCLTISALTHLSLSHPPPSISWTKLLSLAKHIPTLTHLSLAHWPTPCLTPNSTTATIKSNVAPAVSYGGTNFYSHSLDNDWSEAASILRRLSQSLYSLTYLDLDGCTSWAPALRFTGSDILGIDWVKHWGKVREIQLRSKYEFDEERITIRDQLAWKRAILEALETEKWIRRRRGWIVVKSDDWERWDSHPDLPAMPEKTFWDQRRDNARTGWSWIEGEAEVGPTVPRMTAWE